MQTAPTGWTDEFESYMMDEQFVEVTLDMTDATVFANATVITTSGETAISDVSGIVGTDPLVKYGTLETDIWLLDGNTPWVDTSDLGYAGYIGEKISNADRTFTGGVVIAIDVGSETTTSGITIEWSTLFNEWATDFTVTYYDSNDTVIETKTITGNTKAISYVEGEVEDYTYFKINIVKWCLPDRHPRIERVIAGRRAVFTKSDLQSFKIEQTVSRINSELPTASLSFTIDNSDGAYSSSDFLAYLKRMQKITTRVGITVDGTPTYVDGGTFWLDSWDFPNGGISPSFTARDALYFMSTQYIKGMYVANGTGLKTLAQTVLNDAMSVFPVIEAYDVSGMTDSRTTVAPLPVCTYAECLQYIAQAGGYTLSLKRNGNIAIGSIPGSGTVDIDSVNIIKYPQTKLLPELKSLECNVYDYDYVEVPTDNDRYPNVLGYNQVTAADVTEILLAATNIGAGLPSGLTPEQEEKADADRDGMITAVDAALVQEYITACGAGYYTDSPAGWAMFLNIENGNKEKIYDGNHDINGTETITITHDPAAEVNVWLEGGTPTLVSVVGYSRATNITITASGVVNVKVYGYPINMNTHTYKKGNSATGDMEYIDNPIITNDADAGYSTDAVKDWLSKRVQYELSEFRADPRIDAGDTLTIGDDTIHVESIRYDFKGFFHGSVVGRLE